MHSFLKYLRRDKSSVAGTIGLGFQADGISVASVCPADGDQLCLDHCAFEPCETASQRLNTLKALVQRHGWGNRSCRLVLPATEYKLLHVEAPEVPEPEMKEAIRWCIQDLIDFPVQQAVIDYFLRPNFHEPNSGRIITVTVTREEVVSGYANLCEQAGLSLDVIDIQELALLNVVAKVPEDANGVGFLYLRDGEGLLVLEKKSLIYVSRKFEASLDMKNFGSGRSGTSELLEANLMLEIQRSLDYYEREFAMPPIVNLVVSPLGVGTLEVLGYLNGNLGLVARVLDISALLQCHSKIDDATQSRCLPAIGAALRIEGRRH